MLIQPSNSNLNTANLLAKKIKQMKCKQKILEKTVT